MGKILGSLRGQVAGDGEVWASTGWDLAWWLEFGAGSRRIRQMALPEIFGYWGG